MDPLRAEIVGHHHPCAQVRVRRDRPNGNCCSFLWPRFHHVRLRERAVAPPGMEGRRAHVRGRPYVALPRLHEDVHFLSDVVFGLAAVVRPGRDHHDRHFMVPPMPVPVAAWASRRRVVPLRSRVSVHGPEPPRSGSTSTTPKDAWWGPSPAGGGVSARRRRRQRSRRRRRGRSCSSAARPTRRTGAGTVGGRPRERGEEFDETLVREAAREPTTRARRGSSLAASDADFFSRLRTVDLARRPPAPRGLPECLATSGAPDGTRATSSITWPSTLRTDVLPSFRPSPPRSWSSLLRRRGGPDVLDGRLAPNMPFLWLTSSHACRAG